MWLVEMVSYLIGPTVASFVNAVITGILGIFILLWNISPVALIAFIIILFALSKLSVLLSSVVFWIGAAYAAYHYNHPVIACLLVIYLIKKLLKKDTQVLSDEEIEEASERGREQAREDLFMCEDVRLRPEPEPVEPIKLTSPVSGTVSNVNVRPGAVVSFGEMVVSINTGEGEVVVTAPRDGIVFNVFVTIGRNVKKGEPLLQL